MLPISHGVLTRVLDTVYLALMTNLLLVLACLPVVLTLLTTDPAHSWAALVGFAPLVAPAFTAATVVFADFSEDGSVEVVRTFTRAWRANVRRSLLIGAAATATLVVLVVDVRVLGGLRVGAVAVPMLLTLAVLVVVAAVLTLVAVAQRPDVTVVRLLRASLFLGLRRCHLTVVSLLVLGLLAVVTISRPAIGLGVAAAPLVYVVWANSRYTLAPILPVRSGTADPVEPTRAAHPHRQGA